MMKRKWLSYLLILSLVLCGLPAKTSFAADYKYAVEGEDARGPFVLNVSSVFNGPHYINGYCFSDMCYYEQNNYTNMICTVTNVSEVERGITLPDIHIYDDAGIRIASFGGIIGELKPGQSAQLNAGATLSGVIDAYDYTVTFSQNDFLNPDEEITIKKGIVCTSHEIKENDTVTLICEESDEGVVYQWFWSDNRSGGGHRMEGANARKLILSNISLEQYGRFYYCQINKKGKIEYTDRLELIITPVAPSKPTASPTPKPTASAKPSPTASPTPGSKPTAAPTSKPTEKPTTKPTATPTPKPTEKPTATSTPKPTAEPTEVVSPSPSAVPGAADVPQISAVPVSSTTPKPTASPNITAFPGQPSKPSQTPGSSEMPDITASPSDSPPQVPALLKVKKIKVKQSSDLKAKLTWEKITADKIAVLRAEKKSGPYRIIKQFSGDKTGYTDKTVKRGKTYYYKVVAHNGDLQIQLSQKDLMVKKIAISYLIAPVISIKKGNSGRQKYVQVFLQKYEGQYADVYMKSNGRFQKLAMKKRTIRSYQRRYRFRYRSGGVTLYFRARTYQMVKGRKRFSPYSKIVKVKI